MRGAYEQQLKETKENLRKVNEQLGQATETARLLSEQKATLETKATQVDDLSKKLATASGVVENQTKLNARLESLMKYPQLLGPEGLELVKNTTLEGEALEKVLSGFAAKVSAAPTVPSGAGGSPPQPAAASATFADKMNQANAAMKEGKFDLFQSLYKEALSLSNAQRPFTPPIDTVDQPGMKPPA
jgi:hypothetical protein